MKVILLVEDDPFILDIYATSLRKEGYKVDVAVTVPIALEKVKSNCPDLLLLDLNLNPRIPGPKDGLDILQAVRRDPKTKSLKVIVISNYDKKEYPEFSELVALGITRSFLKMETTPEEIKNYIKEVLK